MNAVFAALLWLISVAVVVDGNAVTDDLSQICEVMRSIERDLIGPDSANLHEISPVLETIIGLKFEQQNEICKENENPLLMTGNDAILIYETKIKSLTVGFVVERASRAVISIILRSK